MNHLLSKVIPGQSSVRNGDAGRLAPLYKLQIGLSAHAYLTAIGKATSGEIQRWYYPQSQHQPNEIYDQHRQW